MLKSRFLSPEQTELQTQLRRNIRVRLRATFEARVYEGIDEYCCSPSKIESPKWRTTCNLPKRSSMSSKQGDQASSKQIYPCSPFLLLILSNFRPPSLDTVNRTSRNIDLALRQQTVDVSALSARVAKLNLDSGSPSGTPSRTRERDVARRPLDVTPHVASTTAAALNAEQSAHRLKEALLSVRTEPLLNTQATQAKPAPRAFDTPQKPSVDPAPSAASGGGSTLFATPFTLPPLGGSSSSPPASTGRRGNAQKYHSKSVPLKSAPTGSTPPKTSFDWGPLPGIKPMTTLSSDLRSKTS